MRQLGVDGVAQVGDAEAGDHGRIAEDDRSAGKVIEESNAGAEQDGGEVDVDFIDQSGVEALLDGIRAVNAHGFPGDGGCDAVGDKVDGRTGTRPSAGI